MRKIIYKLFFVAGLMASAFGAADDAAANAGFDRFPVTTTFTIMDDDNKLYFADAIGRNGQSELFVTQHYSHRSHSSHSSHRSHYSHVSSRY